MKKMKLPLPTVNRMFIYLKVFNDLFDSNIAYVTSKKISKITGITSEQIRKDFSFIGKLGKKKYGYNVKFIVEYFSSIFRNLKPINIAIAGIGNLGRALISYKGFEEKGYKIVAGFDIDPDKIGWEINGIKIYHINDITKVTIKKNIDILIITTPKNAILDVLNKIKNLNIKGVLNFASKYIPHNEKFLIRNIDIATEMDYLIYTLFYKNKFRR